MERPINGPPAVLPGGGEGILARPLFYAHVPQLAREKAA